MNVELLKRLKEVVEKAKLLEGSHVSYTYPLQEEFHWNKIPDWFDMKRVYVNTRCGSVGCIIGFGLGLEGVENPGYGLTAFANLFEISSDVALSLCDPGCAIQSPRPFPEIFKEESYSDITPQHAAQAIQNVIDGGQTVEEIWKHILK